MGCNGRNGYVTVNSSAPGLNVKKNPYCCSVVTVNNKNSVQPLTFGCSTSRGLGQEPQPGSPTSI